jgi:hypothetical protein
VGVAKAPAVSTALAQIKIVAEVTFLFIEKRRATPQNKTALQLVRDPQEEMSALLLFLPGTAPPWCKSLVHLISAL